MNNRRNYYRVLQVQPDAPFEIIRSSYLTLMGKLKHHPDLGGDHWNASILNEAYDTLSSSHKRAEYDKHLFENYTKKTIADNSSPRKSSTSIFCPFCKRPLPGQATGEYCPSCKSPLSADGGTQKQGHQRSVNRVKKSGSMRYYSSGPQTGKEARILDLSPKGIRFLCHEELEQKSTIKLSSPILKAVAQVINIQNEEDGVSTSYSVGARFLTVSFAKQKGSFLSRSI